MLMFTSLLPASVVQTAILFWLLRTLATQPATASTPAILSPITESSTETQYSLYSSFSRLGKTMIHLPPRVLYWPPRLVRACGWRHLVFPHRLDSVEEHVVVAPVADLARGLDVV